MFSHLQRVRAPVFLSHVRVQIGCQLVPVFVNSSSFRNPLLVLLVPLVHTAEEQNHRMIRQELWNDAYCLRSFVLASVFTAKRKFLADLRLGEKLFLLRSGWISNQATQVFG